MFLFFALSKMFAVADLDPKSAWKHQNFKLLNSHIKLAKKRLEIPFANKNYPTTHATLNISESARDLWSLFLHSD